jgi:hypothetical protein
MCAGARSGSRPRAVRDTRTHTHALSHCRRRPHTRPCKCAVDIHTHSCRQSRGAMARTPHYLWRVCMLCLHSHKGMPPFSLSAAHMARFHPRRPLRATTPFGIPICRTTSPAGVYRSRSAMQKVNAVTANTTNAAPKRPKLTSVWLTRPSAETELNCTPSDETKLRTSDIDAMSAM